MAMPREALFDHLSDNARRFHERHTKWSLQSFHIELSNMAKLAIDSMTDAKPKRDAHWQAVAAFKLAREIERQAMETGEVV
jgi:hypothetical protein